MKRYLSILAVAGVGLALSACGGVHSVVSRQPTGIDGIRAVAIAPVEVVSKEQNANALALNAQWKKSCEEELQSLFAGKKISVSSDSPATVACRINVVYGNKALRYWVGFGAGSGGLTVTIELKDRGGNVQYATESRADLAVGAFGGNMSEVARKAIQTAVKEFGSKW